jgi:hypothetical protein
LLPTHSLKDQKENAENDNDKTWIYDDVMRSQQKAPIDKNYGRQNPSHQHRLGLQITLAPCSASGLGYAKVIYHKEDSGADLISCKKTRDNIVKVLEPKICTCNISQILTSIDAND